jgi:preprotein translocase subunit SecG
MLSILITIVHVLVCFFLILVVLAQTGKGQDLASAFGGTGSQTAFGARGTATLMSKITAGAAILFMVTSLSLSYLKPVVGGDTVIPDTPSPAEASEPAAGQDDIAPETDAAAEEAPAEEDEPESEDPPQP